MSSKLYTSKIFPNFVEFSTYSSSIYAYVRVDSATMPKAKELGDAISRLADLGFEYSWCSHNLGYYDSVEDQTLEFNGKVNLTRTEFEALKSKLELELIK